MSPRARLLYLLDVFAMQGCDGCVDYTLRIGCEDAATHVFALRCHVDGCAINTFVGKSEESSIRAQPQGWPASLPRRSSMASRPCLCTDRALPSVAVVPLRRSQLRAGECACGFVPHEHTPIGFLASRASA